MYQNLKYINGANGISAQRIVDGISVYMDPGSPEHQSAVTGMFGAIEPYVPPSAQEILDQKRAAASLDRFTFATRVAEAGHVSFDEAANWAAGNSMPPGVQAVVAGLSASQRGRATLDVLARPEIRRTGPIIPAIAAAFSLTESDLDALFGIS